MVLEKVVGQIFGLLFILGLILGIYSAGAAIFGFGFMLLASAAPFIPDVGFVHSFFLWLIILFSLVFVGRTLK